MCIVIIYTTTGKREDLWETHVKRPKVLKVPKCLYVYELDTIFINLSRVLTSGRD